MSKHRSKKQKVLKCGWVRQISSRSRVLYLSPEAILFREQHILWIKPKGLHTGYYIMPLGIVDITLHPSEMLGPFNCFDAARAYLEVQKGN